MLVDRLNGKDRGDTSNDHTRNIGGFTLIELLVVIAIIALLLSILIPGLKRAKEAGKRSLCLYNVKSLATAWTVYVQENDDKFPRAYTDVEGWIHDIPGYYTNPEEAPVEMQLAALEQGLLYPYLETTEVYRCPVAQKNEMRTYSIPHALNGGNFNGAYGTITIFSMNEIKNTGNRIVFLDDFIRDWDACWMVYNDQPQWWNTTPIRHGSGGNVFSFADTHSEFWSWKDQRTIDLAEKCFADSTPEARSYPESIQPDNPDLERIQTAVWGKMQY